MMQPDELSISVSFCGEQYVVLSDSPFVIGREGDLAIDDNPFLHRQFLQLSHHDSLWWLANVGNQLSATIADAQGSMQAWLASGARVPLVFDRTLVWFTAGPTTYEIEVIVGDSPFVPVEPMPSEAGDTTIGRTNFTPDQKLLVVALCEEALRRLQPGTLTVPTSGEAAQRLGWTVTRFNRKLDNVCQKLTRTGVPGLHGGPGGLALNRRARLVEYALATRLVEVRDLDLLPLNSLTAN